MVFFSELQDEVINETLVIRVRSVLVDTMASRTSAAVPPVLIELTKKVLRAFYDPTCTAVVDILIKELCVREDDLAVVLSLDRSFLTSCITRLVKDKLLQKKEEIDPTAPPPEEGEREKKHTYYFIDYEMVVNVVRLRIHLIQQSIKKAAKQNLTERPKASCTNCAKGFSDLEMDRVIDMTTGNFICDVCNGIVEYDDSKVDTNQMEISDLEAKFNRQFVPFLELLKQAENEKIVLAIAAPEPTRRNLRSSQGAVGASDLVFSAKQQITIDFAGIDKVREAKAMPILHQRNGLGRDVLGGVSPMGGNSKATSDSQDATSKEMEPQDESIMSLLTTTESAPVAGNASSTGSAVPPPHTGLATPALPTHADMKLTGADDDDETEMVTVAGTNVPYEDISEQHISDMTEEERTYYMELKSILG
eukprot:m.52122 g.52122  ORF g.52122 m.52122 type:complete len:420 (+) comp15384_c0_seq1:279-1538(+)